MVQRTRTRAVKRVARSLCLVALITLIARDASAQRVRRPTGLDLGVGVFAGSQSGPSRSSSGPTANALLAWRGDSLGAGTLLAALSASTQASISNTLCIARSGSGCPEDFPELLVFGLLGGWRYQEVERGPSLRVMLGPAYARAEQGSALGVQSRADLSTSPFGRVALVGWVQFLLVPDLLDQHARTQALGIGLRVQ